METNNHVPSTEDLQFTFSYFRSLWSKESTTVTLHDLYLETISPLWKAKTECYRKLNASPERANEAKMTKQSLPAVIIEGVCRPNSSHAAANLERMNGLAMYDLDHTAERTEEIKRLFSQLPYVAYMHTSISGEGLKVIVYLDARTPEEYPVAYAICRQTLERIGAHACDEQCARITQPCSCVWDTDAYYTPTPQPYPWREALTADPSLAPTVSLPPTTSSTASPIPPATDACGYIEAFVRQFHTYHPWQKGNRHITMLALGRSARRKGFSKEELEKLTSIMAVEIVGDGYSAKDLQKDLATGYQFVDRSYTPKQSQTPLTLLTTDTLTVSTPDAEVDKAEEMLIKDEEVRASAPFIPDQVYTRLPDFLNEALTPARNKRERDILLLGLLTNLSGCMPQVHITFDQRPYTPHLYLLVIAPPASGKGVLTLAAMLPDAINNYLKGENKRKKDAYKRELQEWEQSQHSSGKKNPHSTSATMPEEPEEFYLCGAPNTSRNQLINRLKINGDLGLIINASELDMISGSIKQDYGKQDDVFRAAFHHEAVATDFKTDRQLIRAETPRLALCLSGTPNQLPAFIRSIQNGLLSRFDCYTCEAHWQFHSAAPVKGKEDYTSLYKRLSQEVLNMYCLFRQSPTEVKLTDHQWQEHTAYFTRLLNEVDSEQADAPGSIILRGALIVARIATVLTALRKAEGAMHMNDYYCTDEDFSTAMDIVKTTLHHSLLLASSLPGDDVKSKPLKSYFRLRPIIESLPKTFTYKEIKIKAEKAGIIERTMCRYLTKMSVLGFIEKQEDKYIKIRKITEK